MSFQLVAVQYLGSLLEGAVERSETEGVKKGTIMNESYIPQINSYVNSIADELKAVALNIHANPELGNTEEKASARLCELLNNHGFAVEKPYMGIPTAFRAVYDTGVPGPKLAMLCEYDALPEIGHGCGHNLIAMVGAGSGIAIKEFLPRGEIHVIGTPAEETEGAKVIMADKGAFGGYDAVMMAHPHAESFDSYNSNALIARYIEFFGKTSHAAASPEEGVNALDAMISFFNSVGLLRQQIRDGQRIHGVILNGGEAPNIIPDYTKAKFYIRSHKMSEATELAERVYNCARGAAVQTGCTVKISQAEIDFKDMVSNMTLSDLACDNMECFEGEKIPRRGGGVTMGSSDMGDVSYKAPAIQLSFGIDPPEGSRPALHTREFASLACSPYALDAAIRFIKGFAKTAVDLATDPKLIESIKREFDETFAV